MILDPQMPAAFIAKREARTVPKGWRHPKDERGKFRPLLPAERWPATPAAVRVWMVEYESAEPPSRDAYMPDTADLPAERAEIIAYETTTEGTPISPPFPNTPEGRRELVANCAKHAKTWGHHTAEAEAWAAMLFGEGAAVTLDGVVLAADS